MPFHRSGNIRYYTFASLDEAGLTHAVFTRQGGVSPAPWDTLNLGSTVGDDPHRVAENRQLVFRSRGRNPDTLYDVWQVHSGKVVIADAPRKPNIPHLQADAILTAKPEVTLLMRFADCVPILLYDPINRVVGIVHSGWPGTVQRVAKAAVSVLMASFGSRPENILAAIGPSIGAHHYTIGPDVEEQVRSAFGCEADALLPKETGCVQFDLWAANRLILEECGVHQIELAGLCTACHPEDWYSHRGEKGRTGRFGVLVGL
jgi:purine-nucleoside/S-methyl-5'-thioadenosine phosphorylase / adenosine deaminase